MSARRLCIPAAVVGVFLLLASPASAHVTVSSPDASAGGWGKVVFRIPNEMDKAATTKLTVTLPADQPLAYVSTQPVPGWTVSVTKAKLDEPLKAEGMTLTEALSTITWTATDGGIKPGEFDEFAISGGPLPDAESMRFSAVQTYSDGTVVKWDEAQKKGAAEPEHPEPVLTLADTEGANDETEAKADSQASSDTFARGLGIAAIAIGAVGFGAAARTRKRA